MNSNHGRADMLSRQTASHFRHDAISHHLSPSYPPSWLQLQKLFALLQFSPHQACQGQLSRRVSEAGLMAHSRSHSRVYCAWLTLGPTGCGDKGADHEFWLDGVCLACSGEWERIIQH